MKASRAVSSFPIILGTIAAFLPPALKAATILPIATNPEIAEISGPMAFSGTNYLAVFLSRDSIAAQSIHRSGALAGPPFIDSCQCGSPARRSPCRESQRVSASLVR
jgi:hypothetical protein